MKEFDSIRIVDKGDDSLSFEMTGNVAGSPYDTIVFLLRATSGLIAASAKDSADPQKVADVLQSYSPSVLCRISRTSGTAGRRAQRRSWSGLTFRCARFRKALRRRW